MELPSLEELLVDLEQDSLPPISVGAYRRFVAYGAAGMRALQVYQHLLFTYRLQRTDRVWATTKYLMLGLHMGVRNVKAARGLLTRMGLIMIERERNRGRVGKSYVRLMLLPNPGPATMGAPAAPQVTMGAPDAPQATTGAKNHPVVRRDKCLKKKVKERAAEAAVARKGEHALLRDFFCSEYKRKTGVEYAWNYKRDGANLKHLHDARGADGARAAIDAFFHAPAVQTYTATKGRGWGFGSLLICAPEIDVYLAAEAKASRKRVCGGCGKAWSISGAECPACGGRLQEAASA